MRTNCTRFFMGQEKHVKKSETRLFLSRHGDMSSSLLKRTCLLRTKLYTKSIRFKLVSAISDWRVQDLRTFASIQAQLFRKKLEYFRQNVAQMLSTCVKLYRM